MLSNNCPNNKQYLRKSNTVRYVNAVNATENVKNNIQSVGVYAKILVGTGQKYWWVLGDNYHTCGKRCYISRHMPS
jgi:hypothetical protein